MYFYIFVFHNLCSFKIQIYASSTVFEQLSHAASNYIESSVCLVHRPSSSSATYHLNALAALPRVQAVVTRQPLFQPLCVIDDGTLVSTLASATGLNPKRAMSALTRALLLNGKRNPAVSLSDRTTNLHRAWSTSLGDPTNLSNNRLMTSVFAGVRPAISMLTLPTTTLETAVELSIDLKTKDPITITTLPELPQLPNSPHDRRLDHDPSVARNTQVAQSRVISTNVPRDSPLWTVNTSSVAYRLIPNFAPLNTTSQNPQSLAPDLGGGHDDIDLDTSEDFETALVNDDPAKDQHSPTIFYGINTPNLLIDDASVPLSSAYEPSSHQASGDSWTLLRVYVPKLFDWYRNDFGTSSSSDLLVRMPIFLIFCDCILIIFAQKFVFYYIFRFIFVQSWVAAHHSDVFFRSQVNDFLAARSATIEISRYDWDFDGSVFNPTVSGSFVGD